MALKTPSKDLLSAGTVLSELAHFRLSVECLLCRDQSGRVILGDVIQGINGKKIKLQRDLFQILDDLRPGDSITLQINRDGKSMDVSLNLGGREDLPLDQ